jgi:hypothetical protein
MRKSSRDKRRFPHFAIMGMVRLQQNLRYKSKEAYLANISGGAIGLYSHKRLRLGETYYIRPMSWNNLDELWTIKAEGDFIMASFKFTSLTDQEFDRIKKRLLLSFRL